VDYLLKPVRPERLIAAVERVRSRMHQRKAQGAREEQPPLRLVTSTRGVIRCFDVGEVTRFWASEKYTLFHAQGAVQLSEEPLSVLERRLAGRGFVRVHRGELVRADAVEVLRVAADGHEVVLSDGQVAKVSRRALPAMKQALRRLSRS
jgi:two-component system response regulator AlgR